MIPGWHSKSIGAVFNFGNHRARPPNSVARPFRDEALPPAAPRARQRVERRPSEPLISGPRRSAAPGGAAAVAALVPEQVFAHDHEPSLSVTLSPGTIMAIGYRLCSFGMMPAN